MKIVIHSNKGNSLQLAIKLKAKGHDVWMVIGDDKFSNVGHGLIEKIGSVYIGTQKKPDIFYFDGPGMSEHASKIRAMGYHVVGGNQWMDRMQTDEAFCQQMSKSCGLRVPNTIRFDDPDSAKSYMKENLHRWVVRSESTHAFSSSLHDETWTYMDCLPRDKAVTIQEYIPGNELYTESWFIDGKHSFSLGAFENRRLMDGDLGPYVDPQSTACWYYPMREPRVCQLMVKKLFTLIERSHYTGPVGIRAIVSDKDKNPYMLRFYACSPRNITACRTALFADEFEAILEGVINGELNRPAYDDGYGYAVTVSVPPYPNVRYAVATRGQLLDGVDVGGSFMPHDVASHDGRLKTAGTSGLVGYIISNGDTIEDARKNAVRHLDKMILTNKQYRRGGSATRFGRDVFKLGLFGYEVPGAKR